MTLYLVRHAQAGSRSDWTGDDRTRPLTSVGRHQSADLVGMLAEMGVKKVFSSPYTRCVETAAPLAARIGVSVIITEALAEGPHQQALALVRSLAHEHAVLCSHGDVIPALLDAFAFVDGLDLGASPRCQKGSVWVLEPDAEARSIAAAQYIPPAR